MSGHNPIKMDALRLMYAALGFSDIQSYIQSGNVIFRSESTESKILEKTITNKILQTFNSNIPVWVLTAVELKTALENNPFVKDTTKDPSFIHLTFLSETPNDSLIKQIPSEKFLPDKFSVSGKTIYLYCPNGYGNTKLSNAFFESKLKLKATSRNLRTANELLAMSQK